MAHLYLLLLIIAFFGCTVAKEIPGFWSLDCGGEGFEASNGITWVSDNGFIRTGVSRKGQNGFRLRAFPSKNTKKNCYSIPVGKGVKILVRLTFNYGNYDGLASPPEMELIFDGYDWGSFQTTMEGGDLMEVIYVTKRNNTNICFGRTSSDQDPFAYTIEVRTLKLNMYDGVDESEVLDLWSRNAFGANKSIEYPDDRYDRWWYPESVGFQVLRSDTNYTNTTNWPVDYPPPLVTRTAVRPLNGTSSQLSIELRYLPSYQIPIYYSLYFSEMSNKTTYGSRAFDLLINGTQRNTKAIIPPYQGVLRFYGSRVEANNDTTLELVSTENATLPPIISAMEVYDIRSGGNVTYEIDVTALGILQKSFTSLQNWTGDPCLPKKYNWEWVTCSNDSIPRIKELRLGGYALSGSLPDFSKLTALVTIDLHNNSLTGDIPAFLGSLPSLTTLNLSMNDFSSVPSTLTRNTLIKLDITGNPKLCNPEETCVGNRLGPSPSPSSPPSSSNSGGMIDHQVTVQVLLLKFVLFLISTVFFVV